MSNKVVCFSSIKHCDLEEFNIQQDDMGLTCASVLKHYITEHFIFKI